uniref:Uncharacterized protein n=1 Tax=Periophthalmus magnuspinnatus TaxID=409849 RepID=A0A3B4B8B9_9GOBI
MVADPAEAERPEPAPGAAHCPATPEEGGAPTTWGALAAQTQGCSRGQANRTKTDLVRPEHKQINITYCVSFRCIFAQARLVAFTEFMTASSQGHMDVIFKYLSKGGNPDVHDELNRTALHLACLEGHPPVVSMLLERGADINFPDRLGSVAMHWACRGGSLRVVQALTSHGADLNVKDKLWSTPLHVATRTGHVVIVEYLLSCGAKVNATDWEGDTALHDAVRLNRYKIVKMLILGTYFPAIISGSNVYNGGLFTLDQLHAGHNYSLEILCPLCGFL